MASLIVTGAFLIGIGVAGQNTPRQSAQETIYNTDAVAEAVSAPAQAVGQAVREVAVDVRGMASRASVLPSKPEFVSREVELGRGQSFAALLTDADVDPEDARAAAAALAKTYDVRKMKAGTEVTLNFTRLGNEETLSGAAFMPEATKEVVITRNAQGEFDAVAKNTPIERQRFAVSATIKGSLHETGRKEGIPRSVMAALIRAYSHAIDFQRDIRAGDKLELMYDQPTAKDGSPVGQGVIIYASINVGGKAMPLYRVTFADGSVDYLDEQGKSVKRALLRTPIDGARPTSGFGMRMHPLLGFNKMHQGVDFGAPTGTPIFAAGSGTVVEVGFKGGYGRYIRIRHNNRTETAYAHMSKFGRNMYQGARVNQGDVIGLVGSSGRSTGPHLHFEVRVDGSAVNPNGVNMPTGRELSGKALAQFKQGQSGIMREFSGLVGDPAGDKTASVSLATSKSGVESSESAEP